MRKGDQILQELLQHPSQLHELKRISRIPDEAAVWFTIVHVGVANLTVKPDKGRYRVRVKHGAKAWSVQRETAEADAVPAVTPEGQGGSIADFNSTCLFIMTTGLQPVLRFRVQRQHKFRRSHIWQTVGWAEIPISKLAQAGRAVVEDHKVLIMKAKTQSRDCVLVGDQATLAESVGTLSLVWETRPFALGDLRAHGLGVGAVVERPMPGQDGLGYVHGIPVQRAPQASEVRSLTSYPSPSSSTPLSDGSPFNVPVVAHPSDDLRPTRHTNMRAELRLRRRADRERAHEDSNSGESLESDAGTPLSDDSDEAISGTSSDESYFSFAGCRARDFFRCKCR